MNAKKWFKEGHMTIVNGHKIFYYDSGQQDKQTLVILHGYPTSSYDYHKVLPSLTQHFRIIVHDHLGCGFSDKPKDYSYSLIEQADMALLLWQQLGIKKAHLLGHDYGTSVSTEILARDLLFSEKNINIQSLTLCNGSIHIEMAHLRLIQRLLLNKISGPLIARLSSKKTLAKNLKKIYFDSKQLTEQEIDAIWSMMIYNNGRATLHQLTQYIRQRYKYWHRWIGALKRTTLSINVIWAENDPIAVIEMAHLIHQETKNSQLKTLSQLGHFPMMENPQKWGKAVIEMIQQNT